MRKWFVEVLLKGKLTVMCIFLSCGPVRSNGFGILMLDLLEGKQKVKLGVLMSPGLDSYLGINWCKYLSLMYVLSWKLTKLCLQC